MRKLYARYTDDRLIEVAIPPTVTIWTQPPTQGATPVAPIGWKLEGWEGWIDTEGLRSLIILDNTVGDAALQSSGASQQEIADLRKLISQGQPKQPTTLEGQPDDGPNYANTL